MKTQGKKWVKCVPYGVGAVFVVIGVVIALFLKDFGNSNEKPKKQVQQITIIAPPPPPPPPPEMKEPEVKDEVVEETPEEPEPAEDVAEADPGEDPAIGEGTESGLQLGRKGKVGFSGGGGSFGNVIKAEINKAILRDEQLRALEYEAIVTIWLDDDGGFNRFEVELVAGSDSTRSHIVRLLDDLGGIGKPKPIEEKANRFRFHITSVI